MSIRKLLIIGFVFLTSAMQAQDPMPVKMEYFLDSDPGHGNGRSISGIDVGENQLTFDVSDAAPGPHVLSVRSQDSKGNWSQTISRTFYVVDKMDAQNPTRIEYFLDSDPGYGNGITISNVQIGSNQLTFDVSTAAPGPHVLSVRSQDAAGRWSQTISRTFFIDRLQDIVYVEYFVDNDPGVGKGYSLALPDIPYKAHLTLEFEINTVGLSTGQHVLYVRGLDALGQWTEIREHQFTIFKQGGEEIVSNGELNRIEYFFDTDPGYGNGFPLEDPKTGENTYLMSFESINEGVHVLCLRAQDDVGHWSQTMSRTIYAIKPVGEVVAVEYFFDKDPGEGKGEAVKLPTDLSAPFIFEVPFDNLSANVHQFCVRAMDSYGNWSILRKSEIEVIDLSGINGIGADGKFGDVYDLNGRKLTPEMISKGGKAKRIYIIDGRKFVK